MIFRTESHLEVLKIKKFNEFVYTYIPRLEFRLASMLSHKINS